PGRRWLDLGCGTGQLVRALQETGARVAGVDHDARPVFAEIRRVWREDGHAIITFTHRDSWLLKLNYLLNRRRRDGGDRLYNAREIVGELEQVGFRLIEVRFYCACKEDCGLTARGRCQTNFQGPSWRRRITA
ncbi:MAG: methyltransferase domain-containing protein, partial [Verrucomicrobiae bacterium]|nr:methyltransferase domain-containing protein [Verrucomicrobiae bacterium]